MNLKRITRNFAVLGFLAAGVPAFASSSASHGPFGLGVVLGEPTGLSAKLWQDSKHAWDFGAAYSFNDYMLLWADYLWHFPGAFKQVAALTPYVGIGPEAFISSKSDRAENGVHDGRSAGLGARIPLGVEYVLHSAPIGFFGELVPGIGIAPTVDFFFQGGIGARFYF